MAPPVLYYKEPSDGTWVPFGTTDPVANEVQVVATVAPTDLLTEIWVDPSGPGTDADWVQLDARYLQVTGGSISGPLYLPIGTPAYSNEAVSKGYVDSQVTAVTNAAVAAHMPVGSIVRFAGKYVPPGWFRCDGTPHTSWALRAALESPNTPVLPAEHGIGYLIYGGP